MWLVMSAKWRLGDTTMTNKEMDEIVAYVERSNKISVIKERLESSIAYNEPVAFTPEQSALLLEIIPWYQVE